MTSKNRAYDVLNKVEKSAGRSPESTWDILEGVLRKELELVRVAHSCGRILEAFLEMVRENYEDGPVDVWDVLEDLLKLRSILQSLHAERLETARQEDRFDPLYTRMVNNSRWMRDHEFFDVHGDVRVKALTSLHDNLASVYSEEGMSPPTEAPLEEIAQYISKERQLYLEDEQLLRIKLHRKITRFASFVEKD